MTVADSKFALLLQEQIEHELHAAQQYLAIQVWYEHNDFPQLASLFSRHVDEEREHAMKIVSYLDDRDIKPEIPAIPAVVNDFADFREPLTVALEHEKKVSEQIRTLAQAALDERDTMGMSFIEFYLDEQVEEEAYFDRLVTVSQREGANAFELENFIAREYGSSAE